MKITASVQLSQITIVSIFMYYIYPYGRVSCVCVCVYSKGNRMRNYFYIVENNDKTRPFHYEADECLSLSLSLSLYVYVCVCVWTMKGTKNAYVIHSARIIGRKAYRIYRSKKKCTEIYKVIIKKGMEQQQQGNRLS